MSKRIIFIFSFLIPLALLCFTNQSVKAQCTSPFPNIEFSVVDTVVAEGSNFCVDVRVNNFQEIIYWIAPISYDPNVLRLTSCSIDKDVEYNHPDIGITFVCDRRMPLDVDGNPAAPPAQAILDNINNQIASGFFNYASGAFFSDFGIADGGTFITLCFEVVGGVGDRTKIDIADIPPFGGVNGTSVEIFNILNGGTEICIDPMIGGNITVGCVSPTTSQPTTCPTNPGADTGNIRFTICGGTPPYQYILNGGAPVTVTNPLEEVIIDGLAAGDYDIEVMGADGMPILISSPVTITSGSPLIIDDVLTQGPSCPSVINFNSTFIEVVTSGGSGNEVYQWSSTGVSVNPLQKIDVGTYAVTVTDGNGCKAIDENIVIDYNAMEMDIDIVEPVCATDPAVVTINVTGGQQDGRGRYNLFTRSTPSSPTNIRIGNITPPYTRMDINPGEVYFRIEDYSFSDPQCFIDTIITVTARQNIELDLTPRNDGCGSGGSIEVLARALTDSSPPLGDLTYRLLDNTGAEVQIITSSNTVETFIGLAEGDYTVEVTDIATGCLYSEPERVPPNTGMGLTIIPTAVSPGCGRQGTITVDVPGDPANYTFTWEDGSVFNGDNIRPNLVAGNYFVTATENGTGCQGESGEIRLREAGSPIDFNDVNLVRINQAPVPCNGQFSGSITVSLRDPNIRAGAIYAWYQDNILMTGETGETITGLGPGIYRVEISGTNICTSTMTYTMAEPSPIDLDIVQPDIVCFGSPTANFTARDLNGRTGLEITWQDTFNDNFLPEGAIQQGAPNSTYFVRATDAASGCSADSVFVVEQHPEFDIVFTSLIGNVCFADTDGEVAVNVSGGSGDGDINYTWSTDPTISTPNLNTQTNLASGMYTLQIFDNQCVSEVIPFEIDGGEEINIDLLNSIITSPSCFGEKDGSADININGGSRIPRLIRFTSLDTIIARFDNSILDGIPAGDYTVQIQDDAGCAGTDNLVIEEPDLFTVAIDSANIQTLSCNSDNTAILRTIVSGGNTDGQRNYSWSHDRMLNNTIATNLVEGEYTFYATDSRGCQDSVTYEMLAPQPIALDFTSLDSVQCFGDRLYFGNLFPTGGTNTGFRFSLGGSLMDVADSVLVSAGSYNLEVRDQDGCVLDTTFTVLEPPQVVVELGPDVEIELGDSHQLRAEHDPEENIVSYAWVTDESIDCLDCPTITVTPEQDAMYGVTIINSDGCEDEDEVFIRVRRTRNVFIPNVINTSISNADASFKLFSGQGVERIEYLRVFDRYGNKVHQVENLSGSALGTADWDARLNGSLVESGVYVYMARVLFTDGEFLNYSGDITVIH